MADIHQMLLDFGKAEAMKIADRKVVEAAAGFLASEENDTGFIYSGWAQTALPHRRLADDALWEVSTDRISLIVQPGVRKTADGAIHVGIPYGSRARLILIYLQSEALRTGSREVALGRSLRVWLGRMGIPIGGKSMTQVRDQCERISRCRMTFEITEGKKSGLVNQQIVDSAMFDEEESSGAPRLLEQVRLSENFYAQLRRHPVPVAEAAVRHLANNSLALDVYCWLAYRLHALSGPTPISWQALQTQFGQSVEKLFHFKAHFKETLALALAVYPEAKALLTDRGVTLYPSPKPADLGQLGQG
jgi:hypothetical protein